MTKVNDSDLEACRFTPYCPFFNDKLADMPAMASSMKMRFCEGNYTVCARYMVLTKFGPKFVPENLYPSSYELAEQIIERQETTE